MAVSAEPSVEDAERYCALMARREAANFYWGFVALPRDKRIAIYALYDFARQVDDAADRAEVHDAPARLSLHRERLHREATHDDPVMMVLERAMRRYRIPTEEAEQIIDGAQMDLERNRYPSWEDLREYCGLVASSVGRMCVRIFGFRDPRALDHASDLGLAMQLTNILRDVREDFLEFGRVYLPQDELERFGISEPRLAASLSCGDAGQGWAGLVRFEVERARRLFASGVRVAELVPTSSAACVLTMAGIYQRILERIERDPCLPLSRRVSLSNRAKLGVMVRAWLRAL